MEHSGEPEQGECREATISRICRAYAAALLYGDEIAAEMAIRDAIDADLSTAEIDDEIIAPALWLVGDLWERGEISVAEEHLATEISVRMLALQREAQRVAQERGDHRVLLATPAGELHVVALRMIANLLRGTGYDVVMLGADVPPTALASAVRRHHPDVVCLSSTMPGGADRTPRGHRRGPAQHARGRLRDRRPRSERVGASAAAHRRLPARRRRHRGGRRARPARGHELDG
jgi:methanogenic corrinoid protein MtbC1